MYKIFIINLFTITISLFSGTSIVNAGMLFEGDGSDDPGFVPPPQDAEAPSPPPANMSGGETFIPYPPPPVAPQSRSEKKNPPKPPVMFTKMKSQYGRLDWCTRPKDLPSLLDKMKKKADVDYSMQIKSFSQLSTNAADNPIIFRTGHFHFDLTDRQIAKLRKYLLNGGMVIFNPGMGSKPFYDSAIKVMKRTFPEKNIERLGPDHPIFHSYYDIGSVNYRPAVRDKGYNSDAPWLEGVTIRCRTVAVVSRWGMGVGWSQVNDPDILAYSNESAQKLGMNIMSYATVQRAWEKQTTNAMEFIDADSTSVGDISVAQIKYNGNWKTRNAGLSVLLQKFNRETDIPVKFARKELRLTNDEIFNSPLLFITGHEQFELSKAAIASLRKYLKKGGTLFAEACCGRPAFDKAFRSLMRQVLPGHSLEKIPRNHMMYAIPDKIQQAPVTSALASRTDSSAIRPKLSGIRLNGHYAVIYSPYGLQGGWELSPNPYSYSYKSKAALNIGTNILMYTVSR